MSKLLHDVFVSGDFLRFHKYDVGQLAHLLVISLLMIHQLVECFCCACVPHAEFDLVLVQGVTVEELLVALEADHSAASLVLVVAWEGPGLLTAVHAVALSTKLAESQLFGRGNDGAAGIAHQATLLIILNFDEGLDLSIVRVSRHPLVEAEDGIGRIKQTTQLAVRSKQNFRDVFIELLVLFFSL